MQVATLPERHEVRFEGESISCGHEVDRVAHERDPNRRPLLDQEGELVGLKVLEPRPQADVGKVRGLRLHADEALESGGGRRGMASQEELACEEGAVQPAPVDDLNVRRHRTIVGRCPSVAYGDHRAMEAHVCTVGYRWR